MFRCVATALVAATFAGSAVAQVPRLFPAQALRGTLEVQQAPAILLNGQPARLSPGSRIRAPNNMLVLPGELTGQRLVVNYTFETNGLVHDVWILRPEEVARKPWPTTPDEARRWAFNPDAQTWIRR